MDEGEETVSAVAAPKGLEIKKQPFEEFPVGTLRALRTTIWTFVSQSHSGSMRVLLFFPCSPEHI